MKPCVERGKVVKLVFFFYPVSCEIDHAIITVKSSPADRGNFSSILPLDHFNFLNL